MLTAYIQCKLQLCSFCGSLSLALVKSYHPMSSVEVYLGPGRGMTAFPTGQRVSLPTEMQGVERYAPLLNEKSLQEWELVGGKGNPVILVYKASSGEDEAEETEAHPLGLEC